MVQNGTYWEYTYVMETNTTIIDVVFNNGGGIWDNNGGNDWHVNVTNCGDEPEPLPPVSSVRQSRRLRPHHDHLQSLRTHLQGVNPVKIHIGRNGWQDVILPNPNMTASGANWTYVYTPPPAPPTSTWSSTTAAPSGTTTAAPTGTSPSKACEDIPTGLAITNPATGTSVSYETAAISLAGIGEGMEGILRWTNKLTGASGTIPAAAIWSLADVPLGVGGNEIVVVGSNTTAGGTVTNAATPPPTPPTATAGTAATTAAPASSGGNSPPSKATAATSSPTRTASACGRTRSDTSPKPSAPSRILWPSARRSACA
jgi:hypothetical protein